METEKETKTLNSPQDLLEGSENIEPNNSSELSTKDKENNQEEVNSAKADGDKNEKEETNSLSTDNEVKEQVA